MNITIIGTGNVAAQLGKAFFAAGHRIAQVFGRDKARATELARLLAAEPIDGMAELDTTADLYVLAVSDEAIAPLAERLPRVDGFVVHCSGATPLSVLRKFRRHGVLYPIQSISKNTALDIAAVPFAIEGNTPRTTDLLLELAQQLSAQSFSCDSEQRLALHVAAVFANNFANAMFQIAHEILQENGLPFDMVRPLILETAQKAQTQDPKDAQTGPARRSDGKTIRAHLEFLEKNPERAEAYRMVSKLIADCE